MAVTTVEVVAAYCDREVTDPQLVEAWKAAESYVLDRCDWDGMGAPLNEPAPDALVRAVELLTGRYLARRSSPDGFLGMGEFGPARVPVSDRDVDRLIFPHRKAVLA